jgi:hypothetical protein
MAPSLRHYEDRQGRELHNYGKYNEGDTGLFIDPVATLPTNHPTRKAAI